MADKQCTILVVDVSASMGKTRHGRSISDLDWALQYVWERITSTVLAGRKTTCIGVIGLRTNETKNDMSSDAEYQNISVFVPPRQILMPDVEELMTRFRPSNTNKGDTTSAVIIGLECIRDFCKKLKYKKHLVLITDGRGSTDGSDNEQIGQQMRSEGVEFTVIGIDFDDEESSFREEGKEATKERNEQVLRDLVTASGGTCVTMAKIAKDLEIPAIKAVRPTPQYKGLLTLGDTSNVRNETIKWDIERYPRVMMAKAITAKQFVIKVDTDNTESPMTMQDEPSDVRMGGTDNASDLTAIKRLRAYQIDDPDIPGGKRDVEQTALSKGFEYGRTAVKIDKEDMNIVNLETEPSFQIVGFVEADTFDRYFEMSRSSVIIPAKFTEENTMALSSLARALHEKSHFAVARFVAKHGKPPMMHLLAPSVEMGLDCLIDVELPYAEDLRYYKFPPLDKVVTVAGKNLYQHRTLPSDELLRAMDDLVECMDVSQDGEDSNGNPIEFGRPEDTYNPSLNRSVEAIKFRATHPTGTKVPEPSEILTRFSKVPQNALSRSKSALSSAIKHAKIKKVDKKEKSRRERRRANPASDLNIDALLNDMQYKRTEISLENAIPDFKALLDTTDREDQVKSISKQMGAVIKKVVADSFGNLSYERAIEMIRTMREELEELEMPELFNGFAEEFKTDLLKEKLGGNRQELWYLVRRNRLGLLEAEETKSQEYYNSNV